ncbi:MAG: ABC transporter ATP-binding protein, partial [Oscillospiraceae bacterium]|nr:ABC transporter ATP-binding protein [Oscillospiraceae bacterium]
ALLGENGAGKSTLMSMLFGLYEPDEGEILVRGQRVRISSPAQATRLNIGMVHQHFKLVENYTITENIVLGQEPKSRFLGLLPAVDLKGAGRKIAALSKRYGLEVDPAQKIEDLNVSTRQRVEILKMLYREAEILIFDEPTAVLTPQEITFLLNIIRELRRSGKTVILITHKLEEIKKAADRCAILNRGKLVGILDVASSSARDMASMMVGREVSFSVEKPPAEFGETLLEVKGLSLKNQDGLFVVKNVSFSVRKGEIFAVAGVSGNGQTELADAITGQLPASGGAVLLGGRDITAMNVRERTLAGLSYIPEDRQEVGLVLDFDLAENLALKQYFRAPFCKKGVLQSAAFAENGEKLISEYDIRSGQGIGTPVRAMSGGNQQKTIIAREIALGSELMIFVQPTRGLDIGAIENIHRQMLAQRDAGKAILLISLELDEIIGLADTIGVMYNGEMLNIAPADTLTANQVGEYMMGVKAV